MRILGVDFGSHTLKISEVERGPLGPIVKTFGVTNYLKDRKKTPDLIETLRELARRARVRSSDALLSLNPLDVFVAEREINVGNKFDEKYIAQLAERFKRELLNKMVNRSAILPLSPSISKREQVARFSFALVPNRTIDTYRKIFKTADLNLVGLQYAPHALGRGLSGQGRSVVIEMGAHSSAWYLFDYGHLRQKSNLAYGGAALTQALALAHGWSTEKAEEHKRSLEGPATTWPKESRLVVETFLQRWWQDLLSVLSERPGFIDKIVLTGGGARFAALRESIFEKYGILPEDWNLPNLAHSAEELRRYLDPQLPVLVNSLASLVSV